MENIAASHIYPSKQTFCYLHRVKRHRHGAYEHVRDGQRRDEEVGRLPDLPVHHEADEDEEVAEGGDDDADGQADRDEDGEEGAEGRRPTFWTARVGTWVEGDEKRS